MTLSRWPLPNKCSPPASRAARGNADGTRGQVNGLSFRRVSARHVRFLCSRACFYGAAIATSVRRRHAAVALDTRRTGAPKAGHADAAIVTFATSHLLSGRQSTRATSGRSIGGPGTLGVFRERFLGNGLARPCCSCFGRRPPHATTGSMCGGADLQVFFSRRGARSSKPQSG